MSRIPTAIAVLGLAVALASPPAEAQNRRHRAVPIQPKVQKHRVHPTPHVKWRAGNRSWRAGQRAWRVNPWNRPWWAPRPWVRNWGPRVWVAPRVVTVLPYGALRIAVGSSVLFYLGGTFYAQVPGGYDVVQPPIGAEVPTIPADAIAVTINGMPYRMHNGVYYWWHPQRAVWIVSAP